MSQVAIKLTSAIGISGVIYRAGSIIEVSDEAAKDLLRRGKGELATEDDQDEPDAPDTAAEPEAEAVPQDAVQESQEADQTATKSKGKGK